MATLEDLADKALRRESLALRSLVQDFLREHPELSKVPRPNVVDLQILGTAAALLELLAQHSNQAVPSWVHEVGMVPRPMFLLEAALRMKRLRALCESESPEPLRKRGLYAPPDFLRFA